MFQDVDKTLHIKGQMIFIQEWQQLLFLACPMLKDLNSLIWTGLFVNDLRYFKKSSAWPGMRERTSHIPLFYER